MATCELRVSSTYSYFYCLLPQRAGESPFEDIIIVGPTRTTISSKWSLDILKCCLKHSLSICSLLRDDRTRHIAFFSAYYCASICIHVYVIDAVFLSYALTSTMTSPSRSISNYKLYYTYVSYSWIHCTPEKLQFYKRSYGFILYSNESQMNCNRLRIYGCLYVCMHVCWFA